MNWPRYTRLVTCIHSFLFDNLLYPPWHTFIKIWNHRPLLLASPWNASILPRLQLETLAFKSNKKVPIILRFNDKTCNHWVSISMTCIKRRHEFWFMVRITVLLKDILRLIYWQQPFLQHIFIIIRVNVIRRPYMTYGAFFYNSPDHLTTSSKFHCFRK